MIGRTIANYEILDKIGAGGMGELYRARDTALDREIAIKFLSSKLVGKEAPLRRLEREARAIAALNHPNIVTIYSVERNEGVPFITMELVKGERLRDLITSEGVQLDRLFEIAIPVADALAAAHGRGVIHRDLKPANVMLTAEGTPKLLDFGLAKFTRPDPTGPISQITTQSDLSREGAVVGTMPYMSPEQLRGSDVDHRSDIYTMGVMLYEMAAGHLPFRGKTPPDVVSQILRDDPPDLTGVRPHLPRQLGRIIGLCLQRDVDNRCQSAVDLRNQLVQLRDEIHSGIAPRVDTGAKASVAVLPFIDLSERKEHGYLADGLAEDLINTLSTIRTVRVAARTSAFSFRNQPLGAQKIGETLRVGTVLEGSVQVARNRVVVRAQLISVATGFPLQSFRFDRELDDIFAIQNEISTQIVRELRGQLVKDPEPTPVFRHPRKRETFSLYLRGRYAYNRRFQGKLMEASGHFNRVIELEPDFAPAYSGLADSLIILGWYTFIAPDAAFPRARSAVTRALELDPDLAEAHTSLASIRHLYDWDLPAAESEFRRAIELKPEYPTCHWWYSFLLMVMGKTEASLTEVDRALELDPLSLVIGATAGWMNTLARRYDRALELLHQTLAMDPTFGLTNIFLGWTLERTQDFDAALEAWHRAERNMDMSSLMLQRAHTEALSGDRESAQRTLADVVATGRYLSPCQQAAVHLALSRGEGGEAWRMGLERVYELLQQARRMHDCWLLTLNIDRRFEPLWGDKRFQEVVRQIGAASSAR
jgi:serine/threonine protein kinase/tetratricopeptide (TPR) repeat protein